MNNQITIIGYINKPVKIVAQSDNDCEFLCNMLIIGRTELSVTSRTITFVSFRALKYEVETYMKI